MVKISNRQSMDSDFMREPVPIDRAVGWPGIAVVIFSIGVTLPVFFLGSEPVSYTHLTLPTKA